jgi:ABC-type siderophore export system fused ATPase/permease subunit
MRARIRKMQQRVVRGVQSTPTVLRRRASAVDVWVQDHHIVLVVVLFGLLGAAAGLLLWTNWDLVVDLARQIAPVLTILSIIVSAILGVIGWFRKRRVARLARQRAETSDLPKPRNEGEDVLAGPGTAVASGDEKPGDTSAEI